MSVLSHIKRTERVLKSALLCGAVFVSLHVSPAQAGFEWTPTTQDLSSVPVVSPQPQRQVVIPAPQSDVVQKSYSDAGIAPLPSLDPGLQFDPNGKVHTMRRGGQDSAQDGTSRTVSQNPAIRMIEKTPAVAVSTPAPMVMSAPASAPVSKARSVSSFVPLSDESSVYSSAQEPRRKTNGSAPVPLVIEAMEDLSQASATSARSYPRRGQAPVPASVSAPAPVFTPPMAPMSELPSLGGGMGISINPYPPIPPASDVVASAPSAPMAPVSMAPSSYEIAPGFGSDIPLIMALQQVVPEQYVYAFAPGLNPAQRVSWQGDRPWDVVLAEMIAPLGLRAQIDENIVSIR